MSNTTARHEACHAVAAKLLGGLEVVRLAAGDRPGCRIRWPEPQTRDEQIEAIKTCAVVGLAGPVLEEDQTAEAVLSDLYGSYDLCCQAISLRDGVPIGRVDQREVQALCAELYKKAAALVRANVPLIARLAERLDDAGELSGAAVDAIVLEYQS